MFSLRDICARIVATLKLPLTDLPCDLQEQVATLRNVVSKPSEIIAEFHLFDDYSRTTLDIADFPQYRVTPGFPFPIVINEMKNIDACVPSNFNFLSMKFLGKSDTQISDLLQFISDVSGCEIGIADIRHVDYLTESDILIDGSLYVIHHTFNGYLSNLLKLLFLFKHRHFCHISHYLREEDAGEGRLYFEDMVEKEIITLEMLSDM